LNYSIRTEDAYVDWVRRFVLFHSKQHPHDMSATEVKAFLTHLAVGGQVAAVTQNQAKAALLFLYRQVLGQVRCQPWGTAGALSGNRLLFSLFSLFVDQTKPSTPSNQKWAHPS
jgi:hypothetical protein